MDPAPSSNTGQSNGFSFSLGGAPRPRPLSATSAQPAPASDRTPISAISSRGTLFGCAFFPPLQFDSRSHVISDGMSKEREEEAPLVIPLEDGWKKRRPLAPPHLKHGEEGAQEERAEPPLLDPEEAALAALPPLLRNRLPGLEQIADEKDKFLADVLQRPDSASRDEYDRVPIAKFGEGLLRGMGWAPGQAIGRYSDKVVPVIQYVRRPEGLGLGATPRPPSPDPDQKAKDAKRILRQGETRGPAPLKALPRGPDGRVRHIREIDEELVEVREPFAPGTPCRIIGGAHEGLPATVLRRRPDGLLLVTLPSEAQVAVPQAHLREEAPSSAPTSGGTKRPPAPRSRSPSPKRARRDPPSAPPTRLPTWLRPDVRVKIVSKSVREGRLYGATAWVLDVLPGGRCSVRPEGGPAAQGLLELTERDLETVVPHPPGRVRVLRGEHEGALGTVLERDSGRQRVQVQLEEELEVVPLRFDDVAQSKD